MGGIGSGVSDQVRIKRSEKAMIVAAFDQMLLNNEKPFCWACGRGYYFSDKPDGWYSPWLVERAHIFAGKRVKDVRACVLLCSMCHKIQHGERIVLDGERVCWPRLEREHLLWLKYTRDCKNYDREFLDTLTINTLPLMHKPPKVYLDSYEQRRGRHDAISA